MASFFEELTKSIVGDSSLQGLSPEEKHQLSELKKEIEEEKNIQRSFYIQIGQKYTDLFGNQPHEALEALCSYIAESLEKVRQKEHQIKVIKNSKICPQCEKECDPMDIYCSGCGTDIRQTKTLQGKSTHCMQCQHALLPGALFCSGCGTRV